MGSTKEPGGTRPEWFRSPDWNAEAKADFEARLARARREGRPQYRRIKALALLGARDAELKAAGRELLEQNITDPDALPFERVTALCVLGADEQDAGDVDAAERHLRAALDLIEATPSGGTELAEVRLAEILLGRGGRAQLEEARALLDRMPASRPLLLGSRFRKCVAGVRIAAALGDEASSAAWARLALQLAAATHSGLANHPRLGLVETDDATLSWLAETALRGPAGGGAGSA